MSQLLTSTLIPLHAAREVPDWWDELYDRSASATIFVSRPWLQSWLDVYSADFDGGWLRWQADGKTVGGCLLLKRTVWWKCIPQPTVFVNVAAETRQLSPWSEFNQALYISGFEKAIAEDLVRRLGKMRWARLEFWGYEDTEFSRALLAALPANNRQVREDRAPFVDLAALDGKEYEASLSSKTRSQIRRTRRMYEEATGPVRLEFAKSCEEALTYLDEMAALHNAIWRARGRTGSFEHREFHDFHRLVVQRLWDVKGVDLLRVLTKDKIIGYLLTFKRGTKLYCYQSGFTIEADKNFKPGLITHATAIAEYAKQGFREYDLLAGDSRYKRSLTKTARTMFWSTSYRNTLLGSALWEARRLKAMLKSGADAESRETVAEDE